MRIRNFTPHEITLMGADGALTRYPSEGIARVAVQSEVVGSLAGAEIVHGTFGAVEGLPATGHPRALCPWIADSDPRLPVLPCEDCRTTDTVYIVSSVVLTALAGTRADVVAPDTSPASVVRDADGKIIGVRRWAR